MPDQANFPTLQPQAGFGQVKRPDIGASSDCESAMDILETSEDAAGVKPGNREGRIQVKGCKKM